MRHPAVRPNENGTGEETGRPDRAPGKSAPLRSVSFDERFPVPRTLLANLKHEYLHREGWVPLERREGRISVLVDNPADLPRRDSIENLLKTKQIEYCLASREDILKFIDHFYGTCYLKEARAQESAAENGDRREEFAAVSETDGTIVRLVNEIINEACLRRASDIHIEPDIRDREVLVRFRVDGECFPYRTLPYDYRAAIVSRIKILSSLDITERRLPQDGKIRHTRPNGEEIELRVATMPTHGYVEDVVLRILTRGKIMTLDELGMPPETLARFISQLDKPYGLILIVGPTGSGKTTTAHAALHRLNRPNTKIWTAEDPVEITQKGIRQVQMHHKIGLDFSTAMRAFLRSDPDIIMVGEMRDYETAKMGVEASTTGHLVLSTLHTNNAPETIVRLLDMGIDPFGFADSLLCVLAQRLVRRLCTHCRESVPISREEWDEMAHQYGEKAFEALGMEFSDKRKISRAKGCPECNDTGYRGMMGIYELLVASDSIKQMIISRKSIAAIRKAASAEGMSTLLQSGIRKVLEGETDLIEILSVCLR